MPTEIYRRCNTVAECYEFMLAYAAQGVSSGDGSQSGARIRDILQRAADSLSGLTDACASVHLRALLTDLFLLTDFAKQHTAAA